MPRTRLSSLTASASGAQRSGGRSKSNRPNRSGKAVAWSRTRRAMVLTSLFITRTCHRFAIWQEPRYRSMAAARGRWPNRDHLFRCRTTIRKARAFHPGSQRSSASDSCMTSETPTSQRPTSPALLHDAAQSDGATPAPKLIISTIKAPTRPLGVRGAMARALILYGPFRPICPDLSHSWATPATNESPRRAG